MKSLPNSFMLSAVQWDIFATLTFRVECRSVDRAASYGLEWLEKVRERMREQVPVFYWYLRPERGEYLGRVHLHALLRVRPCWRSLFVVPKKFVPAAHRLWGRGMTSFRAVEDTFDPVAWYLQKQDSSGADGYEDTKTAACRYGIPSDALLSRALLQQSKGKPEPTGHERPSSALAEVDPA